MLETAGTVLAPRTIATHLWWTIVDAAGVATGVAGALARSSNNGSRQIRSVRAASNWGRSSPRVSRDGMLPLHRRNPRAAHAIVFHQQRELPADILTAPVSAMERVSCLPPLMNAARGRSMTMLSRRQCTGRENRPPPRCRARRDI